MTDRESAHNQQASAATLALPSPVEMGRIDRVAATVTSITTLMENAGRAVARAIRRTMRPCRVLVLCGPGNNGGDGFVAARVLSDMGWPVAVACLIPPAPDSDAGRAAARFRGVRVPFAVEEAARADLVIDAVFGAGLSRPVGGDLAAVLTAARRIVAVDIPSGVDGATGAIRGYAPHAAMTVTFFRAKPGHLLYPGREHVGDLHVCDIGIPSSVLTDVPVACWHNEPGLWRLPVPTAQSHKYTRGVVSLCAGQSMPGATRLAAAGARAAGAGLVRIAARQNAEPFRLGPPGLVIDDAPLSTLLDDARRKVWICGPGLLPSEVDDTLPLLLAAGRCVLADAGALGWAAGVPERLRGVAVITPHEGEFTHLFGAPGDDPLGATRAAARRIGAVVVLKGATTIIAAPDGRAILNTHATPMLGTAGSGDTLTGVIGALLAAGMAPWDAASAGVWLHGEAGLQAGSWPIAEDFDRYLGAARVRATGLQGEARGA